MRLFVFSKKSLLKSIFVFLIFTFSAVFAATGRFAMLDVFLQTQRELPIYCVETNEKKVALTFDAAWGDEYTDEILDILEKNNAKATFFLVGAWVDKYPDKVKKIYQKGHEIGNHSTTHPHFSQISPQKMKEEILKTSDKIKRITGKGTTLFRPPFGDYNSLVVKTVKETGHYCIQWDVDSIDWKDPGEEVIYNRVVSKVTNGSIVLFHNYAKQTPKVLDRIIKDLKAKGFEFVTVSELIYKDNYYIDHTGKQRPIGNNTR
ncbi:polysaccharide deacetylase family sporulation protein PdaB/delta-lactam-biosynthetic de-N-acetylase,TIGR02884 [Caloramator fervidus]|uniref:Polysaccharide deacetylase family sporulation protein PdaB/delta-lactam-biosynthetic de-N-acetylase,TIGR02884 n=1 Tax=Caloramator fervidus TaxID=29344 RepID=A0A1H5U8T2_9CLOT|nr:polysaccharide deacetylase family sporulation protein PdaB [Caloramator fervidus]SEF71444.1 polysaccharide deacetylase family sporulation protein PdaB/delta-lactam-biosynthetic de-N-acetylase,TIGR02884 [Caloramator fervidus]